MCSYDDETANSEWIARTAQKKARKQRNAEKQSSSTPVPQGVGETSNEIVNGHTGPTHAVEPLGADSSAEAPIANPESTEPRDEVMDSD